MDAMLENAGFVVKNSARPKPIGQDLIQNALMPEHFDMRPREECSPQEDEYDSPEKQYNSQGKQYHPPDNQYETRANDYSSQENHYALEDNQYTPQESQHSSQENRPQSQRNLHHHEPLYNPQESLQTSPKTQHNLQETQPYSQGLKQPARKRQYTFREDQHIPQDNHHNFQGNQHNPPENLREDQHNSRDNQQACQENLLTRCWGPGCRVWGKFQGPGKWYCTKHSGSPSQDKVLREALRQYKKGSSRCQVAGCQKSSTFGWPSGGLIRCATHSESGMLSQRTRTCQATGCAKRPCYSWPGENKTHCAEHRDPDMVQKRGCAIEGCQKPKGYGREGNEPKFCAEHAEPGMVKTKVKTCSIDGCFQLASYGHPRKRPIRCEDHAELGMLLDEGTISARKRKLSRTLEGRRRRTRPLSEKTAELIQQMVSASSKRARKGGALLTFLQAVDLHEYWPCLVDGWVDLDELPAITDLELMSMGLPRNAVDRLRETLASWMALQEQVVLGDVEVEEGQAGG